MNTLTGKSVLVIGGAGFIGSHLVDRIIDEGPSHLTVVDNLSTGRNENLDEARRRFPVRLFKQDATDYEDMLFLIRSLEVDVVFNLSVVPLYASLDQPMWSVAQNVALGLVPAELLRQGFFSTLIHFSSSEAYGSAAYVPMDEAHPITPSTPYAAAKAAGDQILLSYRHTFGLDVSIIRPFNNYGPRQGSGPSAGIVPIAIDRIRRQEPVQIYGTGEQTRDFIFVRDTADAAVRIYEEPATRGRIVNIASGREVSINQIVGMLEDHLFLTALASWQPARPGDVRRHWASTALARELIGFEPQTSLTQGLAETVAWYLDREAA